MLFGMPTLIETNTLEECAALCNELGLNFIELNMNLPQYQPTEINAQQLKEIAEKYEIFFTIHLDENLNVSDFNPYVAKAYSRTVEDTIAIAKKLEVPIINMHLPRGVYFTLPDKRVYLFEQYREQYWKSIREFRKLCENAIGNSNVKICIENCDGFTNFQKEALEILLSSSVFGLTFDVGHNHGCGGVDESYMINNQEKLFHMHLHDAIGKKNHLALGTGEVDAAVYLALAEKHDCRVVLETKTVEGLKQSAEWIQNYLRR